MNNRLAFWSAAFLLPMLLIVGWPTMAADSAAKVHRVAMQVDSDDPATMNLTLNNVNNIVRHYDAKGEPVEIVVVTYGPGLHMLRADTSPIKERIKAIAESMPNVSFIACANTRAGMQKAEGKEIPLLPEAHVVPSGVVHLMARQEEGWSYIRP